MPAPPGTSKPAIRTLLLCDLVASTQLVERVGDSAAADLLARHDRSARPVVHVHRPGDRNDLRFARLCARLGLVEFWLATAKWPDCADEVPYDFRAECMRAQHIPKEEFGF
jgi:hypothetical protein